MKTTNKELCDARLKYMSATPRTDAAVEQIRDVEDSVQAIEMLTKHARELEEELERAIDAAFRRDDSFFTL